MNSAEKKEKVARWSVVASALLALGKLLAGLFSGSLALLSESAHALVDTFATFITWLAVRNSHKPADEEHHYGHGKFESLAALFETAILFALAFIICFQAIRRLIHGGTEIRITPIVFIVLIISIIIDINRIRALNRVAKETGSHALAADALHFSSDLAGSMAVLIGLIAATFGFHYGDSIAAIVVALFILIAGFRLGKRTLDTLLDAAPKGETSRIRALLANIPGIVDIRNIRLRSDGNGLLGEIEIDVARTLPLDRVSLIKEQIKHSIQEHFPNANITITASPIALEDESILERIMLVALRRKIPVHHITVQNVEGILSVSLDLEVDGNMKIKTAHSLASKIENAIRDEFGPDTEVDTHIEPLAVTHLTGNNAPALIIKTIEKFLLDCAVNTNAIREIHDVRVRETNNGLIVNYHCRVSPEITVSLAHENIDKIERDLRVQFPEICRVVGHSDLLENASETQ